jgi:hypothetical protein
MPVVSVKIDDRNEADIFKRHDLDEDPMSIDESEYDSSDDSGDDSSGRDNGLLRDCAE